MALDVLIINKASGTAGSGWLPNLGINFTAWFRRSSRSTQPKNQVARGTEGASSFSFSISSYFFGKRAEAALPQMINFGGTQVTKQGNWNITNTADKKILSTSLQTHLSTAEVETYNFDKTRTNISTITTIEKTFRT